jgi:phage terminase small subunit
LECWNYMFLHETFQYETSSRETILYIAGMADHPHKLTDKEELFCQYYAREANGAKAARQAGYDTPHDRQTAYELLTKPYIQARVNDLRKDVVGRFNTAKERMIEELCRIAYGTLAPLFDENGKLKAPSEWNEDEAAIVASIETEETYEGSGEERVWTGYSRKVKLWDKLKAHDQLSKLLGFYAPEKRELSGSLSLTPITGMQFTDDAPAV